jgi:hypothetical protein
MRRPGSSEIFPEFNRENARLRPWRYVNPYDNIFSNRPRLRTGLSEEFPLPTTREYT